MTTVNSQKGLSASPSSAAVAKGTKQAQRFDGKGLSDAERRVPHSVSAEMAVLGAMILEKEAAGQVIPILREECFFRPEHRIIFRALIKLYQEGQPGDPVLLRRELKRSGSLDKIGGAQFIGQLLSSVPSAANVEYYARIVRDKHILRRVIQSCNEILQEAFGDAHETDELLDRAEQRVFEITQDRITAGPQQLGSFLEDTYRQLEERDGEYITGLPSGFVALDELTTGFQNGEMIIVAGRPSMGKTALGLNVAAHVAADPDRGKPIAFFSLEMSKQQIAQRLLCSRAQIDSHRLRKGFLNGEEISKLHTACDALQEAQFFVDDSPGMSILELRAKARLLKVRENISAVFVDYLQLLSAPGLESRQQEISAVSRGLKALARELDVPVIAMAQLNRAVEGRESHRPRMSDLRESGSIEQEADLVMLLHREDYYRDMGEATSDDTEGTAELIIAKQRNGPVGRIDLVFNKKMTCFFPKAAPSISDEMPSYVSDTPF